MDKHYLTPLFCPETIVVFGGHPSDPSSQTPHAKALHQYLLAQPFTGSLQFLDIHTAGTLADLAHAKADLAIIALPAGEVALALELAGRMCCRAARIISIGTDAQAAADLQKKARR